MEFNVLGYAPDNWEPLHTLSLIGYMAWDLAGGWNTEIVISKLEKEFGSSINTWEWGEIHTFTLQHPLGSVKILDTIFKLNKGPYELGGSLNQFRHMDIHF